MKPCYSLVTILLTLIAQFSLAPVAPLHAKEIDDSKHASDKSRETIIIHYGLNDSHSQSWARLNNANQVGITYFQRESGSDEYGALIYKTINPDETTIVDTVTVGNRLEKSVLLYDENTSPQIFVARSTDEDQIIDHYSLDGNNDWRCETILHFYAEGGKFIYELSAETGPDNSFHFLLLKTRSNIDSDDFMEAWRDANLYHVTNASGSWERELIHHYNMAYTYDMYVKTSCRQDIDIDLDGFVHVIFSEQLTGTHDPSRLLYATNKNGAWDVEVALSNIHGLRDDAGWFPSLCLDNNDMPYITCQYINRVMTYSATYARLFLLNRTEAGVWQNEIITGFDDGYHGSDGRDYTGGLTHLVFDSANAPHIVFSDIASTHWPVYNQAWNVGYIRYGTRQGGIWNLETIYEQPLPTGFFDGTEMFGLCLILSESTDTIHIIGQELEVTGVDQYSCRLLEFAWEAQFSSSVPVDDLPVEAPSQGRLLPIYPNPYQPGNLIEYSLQQASHVELTVLSVTGQRVCQLINDIKETGDHQIAWNTRDDSGRLLPSGVYFCTLRSDYGANSRKMMLVR